MSDRFVSTPDQFRVTPPTGRTDDELALRKLARAANPRPSGVESNPHEYEISDEGNPERPDCRVCGVPDRANPLHEAWVQQEEAESRTNTSPDEDNHQS